MPFAVPVESVFRELFPFCVVPADPDPVEPSPVAPVVPFVAELTVVLSDTELTVSIVSVVIVSFAESPVLLPSAFLQENKSPPKSKNNTIFD